MAPPPAARNFQQHQPITTGLRIICESYPSNTCLRELLQNADDACATEIEYVLDTNTYTDSPLLHNDLAEYHGPALLARNNSVFTDEDFVSLSKVGDSRKRNDVATTGKFGQGFNSCLSDVQVYHWTDGPWVYSRCWLLFLDPHQRWSRDTQEPGGPAYDVVANKDCLEIANHIKTFKAFGVDGTQAMDATIIRIPLRTQAQAKTSEIVQREISVEDIKSALEQFANEIYEGGLLFLKHISKVTIRIDNDIVLTAQILGKNQKDSETRKQLPHDFIDLYASSAIRPSQDLFKIFEIAIEYTTKEEQKICEYVVQHAMMASSGDGDMDKWARERKMFPWVAVAAPLIDSSVSYTFRGRLFATLRLPILTHQPVHIHGLFSIAPDRARLSSSGQSPGYDDLATRWNQYMFTHCASTAWLKLLVHQSSNVSNGNHYRLWPRADLSRTEIWSTLDDSVIDLVIEDNLPVWRAANGGCVTFGQGQFSCTDGEAEKYAAALARAEFPMVCLASPLFLRVKERAASLARSINLLVPGAVRDFLRKEARSSRSTNLCAELLEYCLLDSRKTGHLGKKHGGIILAELRGVAIWPTVSGPLTTFPDSQPLFLPRDRAEMQLFTEARSLLTLDTDRLTPLVLSTILDNIADLSSLIRFRTVGDLSIDWPSMYPLVAPSNQFDDSPCRLAGLDHLIRTIWMWIDTVSKEEKFLSFPSSLSNHMLLPINNSRIRRLGTKEDVLPTLIVDESDLLAEFLVSATSRNPEAALPVLDTDLLTPEVVKLLRKRSKTIPELRLTCVDDLERFLIWLTGSKGLITANSLPAKGMLLYHLERLVREQSRKGQLTPNIAKLIRRLPLFNKSTSVAPFEHWIRTVCDLEQSGHLFETPPGLPPMPDIPGVSFYEVSNPSEIYLIRQLHLLEEVSTQDLLTKHLLPWMQDDQDISMLPAKEALVDWVFDISKNPSETWISSVMGWPIVPQPAHSGNRTYRCIKDLVDPCSGFASLYFAEENVFPCLDFAKRHKGALAACGLGNGVNSSTPLLRAAYYSRCGADLDVLRDKIECLLAVPIEPKPGFSETLIGEFRNLKWLPGTSATGEPTLMSPSACRGPDQSQLVDLVWGTFPYVVSKDWKKLLGWDQSVPKEVLFQQLDICLNNRDYERVDSLLSVMKTDYMPGLRSKSCILGSHGDYFLPDRVFLTGSRLTLHPLAPYLDEVDGGFAKKHAVMLKALDVRPEPSVGDLQYVQRALQASENGQLSDEDLNIAIATLEVATLLGYGPSNFAIPDRTSILRSLPEIVHGDPNVNGGIANFNFTHARVSEDLIDRLGIENSFARATRLAIDFEDEDEDEYAPREKLSNIIKDTLGRYPVEATFNEFLANADDARATKISWMIDECDTGPYESQNLLTNELATSQGPALMVYNDGVFSGKDFDGFKEIGQGGKTDDATTTGMFGRGVMSMYHFTDVPMIISGGFYVVLDPQQERLPRNRHWKRKIGVKIALSTIRRVAEGQLLPFHGVYGYDKSQDYYNGTIFRFPFRKSGRQTILNESLRPNSPSTTRSLLEDYFHTARISLLFLTNVTNVDFCIRGQAEPRWCVSAHRSEGSEDEVFRQVIITNTKVDRSMKDVWRVGITDIERSPPDIVKIGKGSSKVTECGIAACLQQGTFDSIPSNRANDHEVVLQHVGEERRWRVDQKVFCKLPTGIESQLPVSFHASFAITGDRKTIAFEDQSELAVWNDWLLTKSLPSFYLDFLKDLSPRLGQQAFRFWPSRLVGARSTTLSSTVAKAFWDQILDPEHIAYEIYPTLDQDNIVLTQGANDLKRPKQRKTRKLHPVTSFTNAQFDFLPPDVSEKLQPLFLELLTDLVRPPDRIWRSLKDASKDLQIVQLNSDRLAEIFHHETNCAYLETFLSHFHREVDKKEILAALLDILIPLPLGDDLTPLKKLHGCRVIPRPSLDAPLGLLTWEPQLDSQCNLIATREEQKLFGFASDLMVNTEIFSSSAINMERDNWPVRRNPVTELIETALNVRKLEIDDLGSLLAHPDSPSALKISSDFRDRWMPMLWSYTNIKFKELRIEAGTPFDSPPLTVDSLLSKAKMLDRSVYRYRANEQWQYLTPREFGTEACIVDPDPKDQQDLCAMIPGLKCLDPSCLPSLLVKPESDLSEAASFQRFLQALRIIGKQQGVAIKTILKEALSAEAKETLRKLVARYTKKSPAPKLVADKIILQTLPIWPCFQRSDLSHVPQHVAAEDSWFCKHSTMFMPWAKDLERFVDPGVVKIEEEWLVELKVPLMSAETFWQRINKDLPRQIVSPFEVEQFLTFIKYLAISKIILSGNVAPNGAGQLCQAKSLYNHDELIFQAAFRGEESVRFLHPDFQNLKHHWLRAGLRSPPLGGLIGKDDYVQCALAIDRQWPPSVPNGAFNRDAETVSAYLQYDRQDFDNWPTSYWDQISRVRMFEVKGSQDDQPAYRRYRMREIAQEHSHCALKDTVTIAHLRVSWSQVKYLRNPPAAGVFAKLPGAGSLPIATVFEHLQFLTGLCKDVSQYDLQEYLKDVQACYDRLQNDPSSKNIPSISEARIFFNMDTTQIDVVHKPDVESSLTTAKLLCLKSPLDPLPIRYVRKFLVPYERLLTALGCQSVVQPPAPVKNASSSNKGFPMSESMTKIIKLRDQGQLTDVTFKAEGIEKSAHKIFLVAVSEYCKAKFSGEWGRLSEQGETVLVEDITYNTLSTMIDFAYTGEYIGPQLKDPKDNDEIADVLDELLDLLVGSNMWLLTRLHTTVEDFLLKAANAEVYVRVDNVVEVRECADHARALRLRRHCEDFITANRSLVEAVGALSA